MREVVCRRIEHIAHCRPIARELGIGTEREVEQMVIVDVPQSIERRIHAPFIPYRRMVLFGSDGGFNANSLVYLLAETGVHVLYPLVDVDATCTIGQNVSILVDGGLITLVARELPLYAVRQSPTVCQRMGLVGSEHPFVDGLLTTTCQITFCVRHVFSRQRTVERLLLRRAIVGVRTAKGKSERKRVVSVYILQILVTVTMHSADARPCRVAV